MTTLETLAWITVIMRVIATIPILFFLYQIWKDKSEGFLLERMRKVLMAISAEFLIAIINLLYGRTATLLGVPDEFTIVVGLLLTSWFLFMGIYSLSILISILKYSEPPPEPVEVLSHNEHTSCNCTTKETHAGPEISSEEPITQSAGTDAP